MHVETMNSTFLYEIRYAPILHSPSQQGTVHRNNLLHPLPHWKALQQQRYSRYINDRIEEDMNNQKDGIAWCDHKDGSWH
mmetsp:Transcript_7680/g.14461  ORF Transcript_7680/g.14461 Transcript_7680/m.14461 type:complete len:80 (+) Transcript_7680:96-335(+)